MVNRWAEAVGERIGVHKEPSNSIGDEESVYREIKKNGSGRGWGGGGDSQNPRSPVELGGILILASSFIIMA